MYAAGKVVAADCHGPVGLVGCTKPDGTPLIAGLKVTGFCNVEETQVGAIDKMRAASYIILEDKFRELGGKFESAEAWSSFAVSDGKL
eukprot:scaffold269908_cov45-Prasinocladus_malaysianus.AAC.2